MDRKISYPQFVDGNSVKQDPESDDNYRYWLKISFKNRTNSKTLCVILKNPSVATDKRCDNTVSKVCNVAKSNGYSEVIILNLFPYRSPQPKAVLDFYKMPDFESKMKDNLCIIQKECKENDVIFAWGTNTISSSKCCKNKYDSAICDVISAIKSKTYYVMRCSCKNRMCNGQHSNIRYPLHGLRWCNNASMIPY